jgi:hypothetical protein
MVASTLCSGTRQKYVDGSLLLVLSPRRPPRQHTGSVCGSGAWYTLIFEPPNSSNAISFSLLKSLKKFDYLFLFRMVIQ